jgi:hypothetical protein
MFADAKSAWCTVLGTSLLMVFLIANQINHAQEHFYLLLAAIYWFDIFSDSTICFKFLEE